MDMLWEKSPPIVGEEDFRDNSYFSLYRKCFLALRFFDNLFFPFCSFLIASWGVTLIQDPPNLDWVRKSCWLVLDSSGTTPGPQLGLVP